MGLDRDERRQWEPHLLVVDGGDVTADQAALLEPLHALMDGRGGQTGGLAEVGERHPAIGGQQREDLPIRLLHCGRLAPRVTGCRA